jgi:hypothetical protein
MERLGQQALALTKSGDDRPRIYTFEDLIDLTIFQSDMEKFLVNTGWLLLKFSPELRQAQGPPADRYPQSPRPPT